MKRTDLKKHAAALLLVLCLLVTSALPALAKFFEKRNAKKQGVDGDHVDYTNQSHPV